MTRPTTGPATGPAAHPVRVLVVGDALIDADVEGASSRLCPDAPVPVVDVARTRRRPGGAALAALLAAFGTQGGQPAQPAQGAQGAQEPPGDSRFGSPAVEVALASPVPEADREELAALLGNRVRLVPLGAAGRLPRKTRIRVSGQSLLRLDDGVLETPDDLSADDVGRLTAELAEADAVLVSDYGLGATSLPALRKALSTAAAGRPVVWDPHPRGSRPTRGTTVVTPNLSEGHGLDPEAKPVPQGLPEASALAARLHQHLSAAVALTLGSRGALLSQPDGGAPLVAPCPPVSGADTCGAGDAFASAVAVALAQGDELPEAVLRAVRRAASFVADGAAARIGVVTTPAQSHPDGEEPPAPRPAEPSTGPVPRLGSLEAAAPVLERARVDGRTIVAAGGCFDLLHAGHVELLEAAAALGDVLVVCVNSDSSVRRLKGPQRPVTPQEDRVRLLMALDCVDAVVLFDEDTPEAVLAQVRPHLWAKGADYTGRHLPEADVLAQWGGEVVLLPVLPGRSTTRLIAAARTERQSEQTLDLTDPGSRPGGQTLDSNSTTERNIHVG
ncbi:MAG: PfkB family carbohydrate kinase [Actinomycetes bacterium]